MASNNREREVNVEKGNEEAVAEQTKMEKSQELEQVQHDVDREKDQTAGDESSKDTRNRSICAVRLVLDEKLLGEETREVENNSDENEEEQTDEAAAEVVADSNTAIEHGKSTDEVCTLKGSGRFNVYTR
eukprot:GHVS01105830.1.p1 GENE.GHVS01105830.1~~GHVS01105830.1.p1  ORF type:complete len:130 (+),score=19.01 GHVS01105830.1:422-811(+)